MVVVTYDLRLDSAISLEPASGTCDVLSWGLYPHYQSQLNCTRINIESSSGVVDLQSSKIESSSECPDLHVVGVDECGATKNATRGPPGMR